ncbi:hypothetical protein N473_12915 [Pseudoalteromonas luteoviolacea CPMOR-1]|uniref:HTH cro/C1-type domain-containing protein n=1 Tax=Pseudoalteromonas luteoviolacea CPMOR-1 TaxID=1365248 RepID=A0A161YS35_9GAMM|nr:helix-turn-helix transcriptional regulator [Pseudoalteromonas luteoviolacea]KZN64933.1 hypothetical protein N473_12915 [Pseudoalteromonas luteoviolacea CPMOR-1]
MRTSERRRKAFNFKVEAQRCIRQIRRELGLSQSGLAKKMVTDVDQSTISNWESGKNEIPLSKFIDILLLGGRNPLLYFDDFGKEEENKKDVKEVAK